MRPAHRPRHPRIPLARGPHPRRHSRHRVGVNLFAIPPPRLTARDAAFSFPPVTFPRHPGSPLPLLLLFPPYPSYRATLSLASVTKRYGPLTALDGVSLAIARGDFFGLIGPDGPGKSTLISFVKPLPRVSFNEEIRFAAIPSASKWSKKKFLLLLICAFAAACTSFGLLLAAVAPNAEAVYGLATFLIMLMCAIGGAWFPVGLMPEFVQQFSKLTLVYWSMEGFSAVLWSGHSLVQILPILGILGGITAAVMGLAIWRFNRGKIFG